MMQRLILFLTLFGLVFGQNDAELPQSACDFCQTVAPRISNFIASGMSEVDIVTKLKQGCAELESISPEFRAKCDGFVGVYVDYMADMITATTNSNEFCVSFGLCDSNVNEPEYTILFPMIYEKNVTYSVLTDAPSTSYKYKIFVGNSSELFGTKMVSLTYQLAFEQPQQTAVMDISNEESQLNSMQCGQESECRLEMVNPRDGAWYFIHIHTVEPTDPEFKFVNFTATEERWTHHTTFVMGRRHGLSLISFILIISTVGAVMCLCISCCLRLRKGKLDRSRRCRAVVLEKGPTDYAPEFEMSYPMVGYYYFPSQEANQVEFSEMQVPQYWTPVPPQPEPQAPSIEQMN